MACLINLCFHIVRTGYNHYVLFFAAESVNSFSMMHKQAMCSITKESNVSSATSFRFGCAVQQKQHDSIVTPEKETVWRVSRLPLAC